MKNSGKYLIGLLASFTFGLSMCQMMPIANDEAVRSPAEFEKPPKPIIVAVIDTGFDFKSDWIDTIKEHPTLRKPRMCKYGHKDFTGFGIEDHHQHGTHISGLIAQYAAGSNYCLVMIKFFDTKENEGINHLDLEMKAIQRAINLKVDIINYSAGGNDKSDRECTLIKKALDLGIVVVTAAGNEHNDINKTPYYPAMCDDRVIAVANADVDGVYAYTSNYTNDVELKARGLYKENGTSVFSVIPNNSSGYMTGTSQAAAIETGKIIKDWKKR